MTATPVLIQGWNLDRVLGSGGFGIVELWTHTSGEKLAIKICKRDTTHLTDIQRKSWISEVQTLKHLKHPNIIKALNLPFKHPDDKINLPVLCMEFCRQGDLRKVLKVVENCCGISEKEAINVMKDISSAVKYLHSNNITHRDLKPENIVLQNEHDTISYKLIDLGYAKEIGEASTNTFTVRTLLEYVAPEILRKDKYSCSADYWSLGILFYELITGITPFLHRMQHTIPWLHLISNKSDEDICAFKSEGKIIFSQDIISPTNLSKNLQSKLVEWFKVVFQWCPEKRGKQYYKNGTSKLVVFEMLDSILSKQIIRVFFASTYKIYAYEVTNADKITDLQDMIEKDIGIPVNQQILTDYFGKILTENQIPLLSQIQNPVLFVFKNESSLIENIPTPHIPKEILEMIGLSQNQLDFETLEDYYRVTIYFIKQEIYMFQLYIFAASIKLDLIITKLDTFNMSMMNTLTNINTVLSELSSVRIKWEKDPINKEKLTVLETNHGKMIKLVEVTNHIKLKFNPLMLESSKLKSTMQSSDYLKDMFQIYNKATKIYELHEAKYSHKSTKPAEMVKLIFEFLKVQGTQFCNEDISKIVDKITKLEIELLKLETIFNSVIATRKIYCKEIQNIIQHSFNNISDISDKKCLSLPNTSHETTKILSDNMKVSSGFNSDQFSNTSCTKHSKIMETGSDVIYDNLMLRFTLDNLLITMQKKYLELLRLEP
ncbi:PREDICTED: inhibitor of nuclear factor kappa-B kinase subunit beta-like [Eufriesea mexicana]|uniref:inhibitor of nuclear factor kappa-B kinase subunit beta-like n=1 Tax=Eufriesea mexicana TaxID=516756 RepID=UPI00083BD628|nr:PREDICTED: inhibitor of nuclear factor kappa-B kinase subunit beta-like [Eufriesea mexicana]